MRRFGIGFQVAVGPMKKLDWAFGKISEASEMAKRRVSIASLSAARSSHERFRAEKIES